MLDLPNVTLCCIDTVTHALALRALRQSSAQIRFGRTVFITDRDMKVTDMDVDIVPALTSREQYSRFVLKSLASRVDTTHVLLVQWDGYVVNPAAWRDEFLASDYIGAQWFWHDDGMRVGNGGFSLRSRKLLLALGDPRVVLAGAEDETICRVFRPLLEREHGIRFAPESIADAFAFEAAFPIGKPFGFHGLFNFCRVVPPEELTELVSHFTPAIVRSPQLLQLGRNCAAMGQWQPASAIFRRIVEEVPGHAEAAAALVKVAANASSTPALSRNDPCHCGSGKRFKSCHGALRAELPSGDNAELEARRRIERAIGRHEQGDVNGAETLYRDVLATEPGHPLAQHFLGVIHYQRGELAVALPLLERSVAASPDEPEFRNNLGLALAAADRESDAIESYRSALDLKPDHAVAWNNLGLALQSINDVRGAIGAFRRAIDLKPAFAQAHWNLSLALLLDGQFADGWREYDWRLALPELGRDRHPFPGPAWDGAAPRGKTLLLYAEQGLGDALQFARYATLLADAGARPLIHCADALRPLIGTVPGVSRVLENGQLPSYDAHFPLLSLPRIFATTASTIPMQASVMTVAQTRRDAARARVDGRRAKLNVGVAWAGNKQHSNDRNRSCPLTALEPLLAIADIAWFSLQQGEARIQIDALADPARMLPLSANAPLVETAALIAELDLVISVDTSIAHLAGALGQRCWLLLPFAPDWRWGLRGDATSWYPTMRLFRQPALRDWSSVVSRVAGELSELMD